MQLDIRKEARGKWSGILSSYGLNDKQLSKKHTACPMCGGKDRFRFTDYKGNGEWICNQCGSGSGFDLVMRMFGMDFKQLAEELKPIVAHFKPRQADEKKDAEKVRAQLHSLFKGATREVITPYLKNRGVTVSPDVWYHPNMLHFHDGVRSFHFGMIGVVSNPIGEAIAAHRTYLTRSGMKANVPDAKKMTNAIESISGGAIRLFQHQGILGIAEGIETACAATQMFGIPTWAAISANGLEKFVAPEGVTHLVIFGDNDSNFVGQDAAYALAKRYAQIAEVRIPEKAGTDWADILKGG